jgi:hypothetical protein
MWALCPTIWKWPRYQPLTGIDGIKRALDEPDCRLIQKLRVPLSKADDLTLELFKGCRVGHQSTLKTVSFSVGVDFSRPLSHLHRVQARKKTADILPAIARFAGDACARLCEFLINCELAKPLEVTPGFNPGSGMSWAEEGGQGEQKSCKDHPFGKPACALLSN